MVVSLPVIAEYLETLERVNIEPKRILHFQYRLLNSPTVSNVNLGKRFKVSRDPDDDLILATADAGHAEYIVTNDKDLLEIADDEKRSFKFEIVTPAQLLRVIQT